MPAAYAMVPIPTVPPSRKPASQDGQFDAHAHQPQRKPGEAVHDAGHQSVARAGPNRAPMYIAVATARSGGFRRSDR